MKKKFLAIPAILVAIAAGVSALPNSVTPVAKADTPDILDVYVAGDWCDPTGGATLTRCAAVAQMIVDDINTRSLDLNDQYGGHLVVCAGDCDQDVGTYSSYLAGWDDYAQDVFDLGEWNHAIFAVPGNHEYSKNKCPCPPGDPDDDAAGYRQYWPDYLPLGGGYTFAPARGVGEPPTSLQWGKLISTDDAYPVLQLIGIDTTKTTLGGPGIQSGSNGYQEFKQLLRNADDGGICTVVVGHHPRWATASGNQEGETYMDDAWRLMSDTTPAYPMRLAENADVYVSGHIHHYERFDRMDESGSAASYKGTRQFVVGTGGDQAQAFNTGAGTPAANSEVRLTPGGSSTGTTGTDDAWGALRLSFRWTGTAEAEYTWAMLDRDGDVIDAPTEEPDWYPCWDIHDE